MSDGVPITPGAGLGVATDEVATNLTGTVAKAASTALTGSGTAFLTELAVGDVVRVPGTANEDRVITVITSNTAATVSVAFTNTASGQVGQRIEHAQLVKQAVSANGSAVLAPVDAVKGATVNLAVGPSTAFNAKSASSIGTSSSNPVAANSARVLLILGNDSSSATIYLALGTTAVANQGIILGPKQTIELTGDQWSGRVDAIATAAATALTISEV